MSMRSASVNRTTSETDIVCELDLDGAGKGDIDTGIPFLDHMLGALSKHSKIDLKLHCKGDIEIDDHHTVEDCALALGSAVNEALGERKGIRRFFSAYAPLDEALVRAVVDLSGRPHPSIELCFRREKLGDLATENIPHFFQSMAMAGRLCLHVDQIKGENDHHISEAAFKAVALALRGAVGLDSRSKDVPSTKGVLV